MLTTDSGRHWNRIDNVNPAYDATLDNHNFLWVNASARGIHEPATAMFFRSKDYGKHWEVIKWNPHLFMPTKILSQPHQPLKILTKDNKVYQLNDGNAQKDWKFIDTVKDDPEADRYGRSRTCLSHIERTLSERH